VLYLKTEMVDVKSSVTVLFFQKKWWSVRYKVHNRILSGNITAANIKPLFWIFTHT